MGNYDGPETRSISADAGFAVAQHFAGMAKNNVVDDIVHEVVLDKP